MSLKSMSHGQCHSIAPNVFHSTASNVIQLTVSNVNDMLSTNKSMPVKSMDMINITTFSLGVDITDVRVTPLEFLTPNNGWTFNQPCLSQDFQPLTRRSRVISYLGADGDDRLYTVHETLIQSTMETFTPSSLRTSSPKNQVF